MTYSYIVGTIGTIKKDNVFYIIRHVEIYVTVYINKCIC